MWDQIQSILFNKIINKFTWVKDSHLLQCYQIKLLKNIFGSKQDRQKLQGMN